jgi:hypothetical protein
MTSVTTTFDTGTIGADCTAGSDGIQSVPDTLKPKFATGFHGAARVEAGNSSNTSDVRARVDLGVSGNHMGSIYLKYETPHSSSGNFHVFMSWATSSNQLPASLRVGSGRELNIRLADNSIVRTGSAGDIPNAAWFRLDWKCASATSIEWKIFYDPEASSGSTPDLSGTITTASFTVSRLVLGPNSATSMTKHWSFDTVRAQNDDTTWWDAFNPPSGSPTVTVWNGTTELATTYKVWDGAAEVAIGSWAVTT